MLNHPCWSARAISLTFALLAGCRAGAAAPSGDGTTEEAAGQTPKAKPSGAGKAAWAAMARAGECVEYEHLLDKLPELAEHPEPHALVARLKQKGVDARAEDVAEGRMVKVTVPSRHVGMFFVPRSLCRQFLDVEKL